MSAEPRLRLYTDRLAIVGETGSGKSELARHLFERARCRRLFVDPKHTWRVKDVKPAYTVADIDWRAPVIHVRPPWFDRAFSDELYRAAFRRLRHAVVLTDESYGVSSPSWHGAGIDAVQTQGRELELGHIALIQRPVNVARTLYTESTHIFVFRGIDDDDLQTLRRSFVWLSLEQLRDELFKLPKYGYLWIDRDRRIVLAADPLPAELRKPKLLFRSEER